LEQWQWTIVSNWGLWGISKLMDIILRTKNENNGIKTSRFIHTGKPIFKGEINDRKDSYNRKTDSVFFKAKYDGKIEHGYFATEIIHPPDSPFLSGTFHLDNASDNVTSFCEKTIIGNIENDWNIHNISTNLGKLNGRNIKTDWLQWAWKIPQFVPKGDYRAIIGLWSDSNEDNDRSIPIQFSERTFHVDDFDDSHYQPRIAN
jgi:hypothetical protein